MGIKTFRRWRPARIMETPHTKRSHEKRHGSARERGYDRDWERVAAEYLKSVNHLCEEHLRRGYLEPAELVDHVESLRDRPKRRLDPTNLDALCRQCHDGWKRRLEAYARRMNQIPLLPMWVKHPDTRPAHFQIRCDGPLREADRCETSEPRTR